MKYVILLGWGLLCCSAAVADDKLFSGPQVGEKLAPFVFKGVLDKDAGQELNVVAKADGKPVVLVFVHEANRPSIGFTRVLMNHVASLAKNDLQGGMVWIAADPTEAENTIKRMQHALPKGVSLGIAPDKEGPGAYGLNRKVTLTVLVGKNNKVTANFALVQPSIQVDLPKVLDAVAAVTGVKAPKLAELPGVKEMMNTRPEADEKLTSMLRALIRKTATDDDVKKTVGEIETYIKNKESARKEVARITKTLVNGGKLADYGTPAAQTQIRKWATELNPDASKEATPKK